MVLVYTLETAPSGKLKTVPHIAQTHCEVGAAPGPGLRCSNRLRVPKALIKFH